jgi:hypothetical protein
MGGGVTGEEATARLTKLPTGQQRVQLLYEEYIHLPALRQARRCSLHFGDS